MSKSSETVTFLKESYPKTVCKKLDCKIMCKTFAILSRPGLMKVKDQKVLTFLSSGLQAHFSLTGWY